MNETKSIKNFNTTKMRGILYILISAFFFSLMSFFVRLSGDIPFWEKSIFRNLVALLVAVVLLKKSGHRFQEVPKNAYPDLFLRCLFGTIGLFLNFYAISNMPIGDANMLNKMAPFFSTLMSIFILKEMPKRRDLVTLCIALLGAIIVIRPGEGLRSLTAVFALLGGLCAGTAYTFVRKLGTHGVYGPIIVFSFSLFSVIAALPMTILHFVPLSPLQLVYLLLAGSAAAIAQLSVTAAYTYAPAKEISVFDYTQVIFASILGMLFLGEFPDYISLIGYAIIIGSAILRWVYNIKHSTD